MQEYSYRHKTCSIVLVAVALFLSLTVLLPTTFASIRASLSEQSSVPVTVPPVILQAGTAGSNTVYANGTSAKASAVAPAPTPTYYPNSYSILSDKWWNDNYDYRMKVTVTNNIASTLSTNYSILLTLNTASLVSYGKMLSSGNDLRMLYWNSSSSSWLELDRVVENMNTASTRVWFSTQTSIAASASDNNYCLYYGYSNAGTPPTNKNLIFSFWNDFDSFTDWTHRKTSEGGTLGTVSVYGSVLTITPGDASSYTDYVIHNGFTTSDSEGFCITTRARARYGSSGEDDLVAAVFFAGIDGNGMVNNDYQTKDKPSLSRIWGLIDGVGSTISSGTGNAADTWYTYDTFRKPTDEIKLMRGGSQVCPASGWSSHSSLSSGYIGVGAEGNNRNYDFDWILVRKYVDPEPSSSLESERTRVINWYDPGWGYRKRIVIDHTKVQTDQTAFPVLINLTSDIDLSSHAQSDGDDILFTSSDGITKLSHELENYTSATGALIAWVKIPSLSSSLDTDLFMYHGNSTCSSQQVATNVWDENFKGVWHLEEDPSSTAPQMKDSTSNGNNGTSYGLMTTSDQVAGKIDGSLYFDGSGDEIQCGNAASLQITTELTIEAWAQTSITGAVEGIVNKQTGATSYNGYQLRKHSDNTYRFATGNPTTAGEYAASDSTYTDSNWRYIVGVIRSGTNYLYIDGVQQTTTFTHAIHSDSGQNFDIGRAYSNYNGYWWDGILDEVRVSNIGRNASWIATCYNNQNSPNTFYTIGALEENPRVSGTIPGSVQNKDSDYLIIKPVATNTTSLSCNPSDYSLLGSTSWVSGAISNLTSDDSISMVLRSYENTSCTLQYYNYSDGESSTTSGTYSDKVILTFTPSLAGSYLVIASAGLRGSSTAYDVRVQMTIDGTAYANPTWQPDEANMWESFLTSKVINFGIGSHTVRIQFSSENFAQTVTIRRARIMVLKLSDYASNEAENQQSVTSGTYTSFVASTFTPSTQGVYLIVATAEVEAASTTESIYTRLQIDGVAKDEMITMGETTTDYEVFAAHNVTTLSAASHTIRIQAYRTGFGTMYIRRARIAAVRLSDYCDYESAGSEGVSSTSSTSWQNKTVLTFTPGTSGSYLIMTTTKIRLNTGTNGYQPAVNFTIDDVEYGYWQAGLTDSTDYLTFAAIVNVSLSASTHTLIIAYRTTNASYIAYIKDARVVAIRLASQYISEAEFIGSANTESWKQLTWTINSAWTIGQVTVTVQVYNYTLAGYPTSGNGYASYNSSSAANTDETTSQIITISSAHFRNESGNWKIKVTGIKITSTQFDFKADWVEFKPTYHSEYMVSTEFLFSGLTTNTPTQLNFTVVSEYSITIVNATIQVWNYSSSAYVTNGEGYSAYTSTGTNVTVNLNITINPQFYVSNGNAKIKITGLKTTTSQYQQQTNQAELVYVYTASPDYNYLLGMTENHGANWKIRLTAYTQSNIGRLNNCSIYVYNGANSTQIVISSGAYNQQTGPWYDLTSSDTEYMWMHVEAAGAGTSYIYVYLEILIPNTTTYARYIVTFIIT